jgi:RNA polymerase sigma-70 factor (family 1)
MNKNAPGDDKLLLLQISEGNEKAFDILVGHYWNNIYGQALTYLKSTHQAQDIVQEVFIKVWEKREKLVQIERFESFLFIMARNHIISELRKKIAGPLEPEVLDTLKEDHIIPDQELSFKQLQQHLKTAIELLPQQQKTAFLLSRDEGLSYEAIAKQMGLSRETVKKHICRALNFLRTYVRIHADVQLSIFMFCFLLSSGL